MSVLDAVYAVDQPRERWLGGVLQALAATMDPGGGVGGMLYDITGEDRFSLETVETVNSPPGWREVGRDMHRDPRFIPRIIELYRNHLCTTLFENAGSPEEAQRVIDEFYGRFGVRGQVMINGIDCSGKGSVVYLFSPQPIFLSAGGRDLLSRLATHLSTAYRLQRRLSGSEPAHPAGVEAVLKPSGQVDHAEGEATSAEARRDLKNAVVQRERARGLTAQDAERLMRSLKGLIDTRWTLVDHYENDGKRFVLARENTPQPLDAGRLSPREQQVVALAALGRSNKLIAYELGLACSTVRVLMARACVKTGARNRSELVARQRTAVSA